MGTVPDDIAKLIERFDRQADQVRSPDYNETQLRIDFINPMFAQLGWDMNNKEGFAEQYREVVHEDRIKVAGATKAPDYSFRIGGVRKFFLEAKKPFVNIAHAVEPAYQLRRYGWSAKLAISLLTDFAELAIYDCRERPKHLARASDARRELIKYTDYPNRWDFIEGTFSKRAVLTGGFDRYCATKKGRGTEEFDEAFLAEIEDWRKKLASNLALRNDINEHDLNFATQRIIDRIIFLRICEDRGVEPTGHLQQLLNGEKTYGRLATLFRDADARYNSGLFHFKRESGRDEAPDELTLELDIDDAALKSILRRLYYPESPYEFSVVSADILGSVYERFLGNVIERRGGQGIKIVEKPEVRKAGGVYYTPAYIVDYIVKQTVGKLLEDKTPKKAAKLKVLDPACGSGSFLLGAYQHLLDWHLKWYVNDGPQKHSKGKTATIRPADKPSYAAPAQNAGALADPGPALGHWALTTQERKRILLDNIHGVDIDYQAVEVTKLSLLLRCLEGETAESLRAFSTLFRERALPDLAHNIQCGNSLIGTDIMATEAWRDMSEDERRKINPFDFERAFPRVFEQSGFDAVIGNPPYIFTRDFGISEPEKAFFHERYKHQSAQLNTFAIFVERSLLLLSGGGHLGFITPNNWLTIGSFAPLRRLLLRHENGALTVMNILDRVFEAADVDTAIVTFRKGPPPSDCVTIAEMKDEAQEFATSVKCAEFSEPDLIIQISMFKDGNTRQLLNRIGSQSEPLSSFATVSTGLKAYQTGKGKPAQTDLIKVSRKFHSNVKKNATYGKYLDGVDVVRYCMSWSGEHLSYGEWLAEPRRSVPFAGPRLLVRQIPSRPPYMVHGAWTDQPYYNDINSMVVFNAAQGVPLKTLLGLINSRLLSFWFAKTYDKMQRRIFPQFKVKELSRFPVSRSVLNRADNQRLAASVDLALSLHAAEAAAKSPAEKERLRRQIEATDRQIDRLVYRLYGLTDDEIKIVEEVTQ